MIAGRRRGPTHGFTLIEVMVASVISLIVLSAAASLALGLLRANTTAKASSVVNSRVALAHSFFNGTLGNIGYLWRVDQEVSGSESTAAFGEGFSAVANATVVPLQICDALPAGCAAPVAANADKIIAIVPRDSILDAVQIQELATPPLLAACGSLGSSPDFQVSGDTAIDWTVGDLILVSKIDHTTLASLGASFSAGAGTDGGVIDRTGFEINFGSNPSNITLDDGARTDPCDARRSLLNARVIRVKVVQIRLSGEELQLSESSTAADLASVTWVGLLNGVDDLQFQLDLAMYPAATDTTTTANTCACNTSAIFDGTAFTAATCPLCGVGERLNGDANDDEVYRLLGLRVGIVVRGDTQTNLPAKSWTGLFDRSGTTIANDRHVRRKATIYLGLPNASTF